MVVRFPQTHSIQNKAMIGAGIIAMHIHVEAGSNTLFNLNVLCIEKSMCFIKSSFSLKYSFEFLCV